MPKRANGEGTIYPYRDGFAAQVTVGRNPSTGKPKRATFYGKTQAEVRKKMTAAAREVDEGTYMQPSKMTVAQWLDVWTREYLNGVKPRTLDLYKQQVRLHLKPTIGALKLSELTAPAVQSLYNAKIKGGLSPKSVINIHGILHKAMKQALKIGYIRINPCDACDLPRIQKREMAILDDSLMSRFLSVIQEHRHYAALFTTVFTGLREGELLGLTWDCIDFEAGIISINKQLQRRKLESGEVTYSFAPVKNSRPRTLTPAPAVLAVLKQQRQKQIEWRWTSKEAWSNPDGLVFTNELGQHIGANTIYHALKKVAATIGAPNVRFHDLRHTYATLSIQNGTDIKTVSQDLGHATTAFTMDVYGHVTDTMKQASAARMEQYIKDIK